MSMGRVFETSVQKIEKKISYLPGMIWVRPKLCSLNLASHHLWESYQNEIKIINTVKPIQYNDHHPYVPKFMAVVDK